MNTFILWSILCVNLFHLAFSVSASRKRKAKMRISSIDPGQAGDAVVRALRDAGERDY